MLGLCDLLLSSAATSAEYDLLKLVKFHTGTAKAYLKEVCCDGVPETEQLPLF